MLIDEVERIWEPIARDDEWSAFYGKLANAAEMADAYGFAATRSGDQRTSEEPAAARD
jgi:hypothetical protein